MDKSRNSIDTAAKTQAINLDSTKYGTFAEIGAGQEVARWFFRVGGASATIAKTISAYDMTVSDAIYGPCVRYVSRERLQAMLKYEYDLLIERLDSKRGDKTKFFVFADTVTTKSYTRKSEWHGWLGVMFQTQPRSEPSEIIIHIRMLDKEAIQQQEALGIMGVNLIYGALYSYNEPRSLLLSLLDNLSTDRVEIDMIKFSGPAFADVDNRLMALELVRNGMTGSAMFTSDGEVVQASEVLYKKPILVERGSFRPVTNATIDMLNCAQQQFIQDLHGGDEEPVILMEITLKNLSDLEGVIDPRDFLDRVDILGTLGKTVLISNYGRYFQLADYLFRYSKKIIGVAMGVPSLKELFEEQYYTDLDGGILESFGRMFRNDLRLYVYPRLDLTTGEIVTLEKFEVPTKLKHLYLFLVQNGYIRDVHGYNPACLPIYSRNVLARIKMGDPSWETMVPEQVARIIKERRLFGYQNADFVASADRIDLEKQG
ncbi:MAG: TonB-dependent receptor [Verrucomicrobiia bacterium]